jgi:hypothetical protein
MRQRAYEWCWRRVVCLLGVACFGGFGVLVVDDVGAGGGVGWGVRSVTTR